MESAPFESATSPDGKEWNFAGGSVAPGDTVVISGINTRRPATIHRWYWVHTGLAGEFHGRFDPPDQRPGYVMPNPANVREELFQGGFGADGLTVGIRGRRLPVRCVKMPFVRNGKACIEL